MKSMIKKRAPFVADLDEIVDTASMEMLIDEDEKEVIDID